LLIARVSRQIAGNVEPELQANTYETRVCGERIVATKPGIRPGQSLSRHREVAHKSAARLISPMVFGSGNSTEGPATAQRSNKSESTCPLAANSPIAIGKSNDEACFGNSAGAELLV